MSTRQFSNNHADMTNQQQNEKDIIHISSREKMIDDQWGSKNDGTANPYKWEIELLAVHKQRQERVTYSFTLPMQRKHSLVAGYFFGSDKPSLRRKLASFASAIEREWGIDPMTEKDKVSVRHC